MQTILSLWWRLVFWWKKRTGWVDLKREIEVTGIVAKVEGTGADGDRNFAVHLDSGQENWITAFDGRLTTGDRSVGPSLHCEVVPWSDGGLKSAYDGLRVGDRVRVRGAWGFDGVHLGVWFPLEVIMALLRHQPNLRGGWFEIHPVASIEVVREEPR